MVNTLLSESHFLLSVSGEEPKLRIYESINQEPSSSSF